MTHAQTTAVNGQPPAVARTQAAVRAYYAATGRDYRRLWQADVGSMHFGYWDGRPASHAEAMERMNAELARAAGLCDQSVVVDAGCGVGGSAIWLARERRCTVFAVNICDFQMPDVMAFAQEAGVAHAVRPLVADYAVLPLPDASVDVFWGVESFVHAPDRAKVAREAFRVLRPGGVLVSADYHVVEEALRTSRDRGLIARWRTGWTMPGLVVCGEWEGMLRAAGFAEIETEDATEAIGPSLAKLGKLLTVAIWVARLGHAFGRFERPRLENNEGSLAMLRARKRGLWRYRLVAARKV